MKKARSLFSKAPVDLGILNVPIWAPGPWPGDYGPKAHVPLGLWAGKLKIAKRKSALEKNQRTLWVAWMDPSRHVVVKEAILAGL